MIDRVRPVVKLIGSDRPCFYCKTGQNSVFLTVPTIVLFGNFVVFVLRIQVGAKSVNNSNCRFVPLLFLFIASTSSGNLNVFD